MAGIYPTPSPSLSSEEAERRRKRRRLQNDSSAETDATVSSTLSSEGYTVERYRVGAPPLQILPLATVKIEQSSRQAQALHPIRRQIGEQLQNFHISPDRRFEILYLCYRGIDGASSGSLTLVIHALWNEASAETWLKAVDGIRGILFGIPILASVKVEILSWQTMTKRRVNIIELEHPLVSAYESRILPSLRDILASEPKVWASLNSIDALRLGYLGSQKAPETFITPNPVVIRILVDWDLERRDWQVAEHEIKTLLIHESLADVEVLFERGDIVETAFNLRPPERGDGQGDVISHDYNDKVGMGVDIGPECYLQSWPSGRPIAGIYGTFGGYILAEEVPVKREAASDRLVVRSDKKSHAHCSSKEKNKKGSGDEADNPDIPKRLILGLTNYHVVRAAARGFRYLDENSEEKVEKEGAEGRNLQQAPKSPGKNPIPGSDLEGKCTDLLSFKRSRSYFN